MRSKFLIFISCFTFPCFAFAQGKMYFANGPYTKPVPVPKAVIAFVTDTTTIGFTVPGLQCQWFPNVLDTSYYFKHRPLNDTFRIFYDSSYARLAVHKTKTGKGCYTTTSWYRNGQLKKVETHTDSMPASLSNVKEWYPNGNLKSELAYTADSCIYLAWWPDKLPAVEKRVGGQQPWQMQQCTGKETRWARMNATISKNQVYKSEESIYSADSTVHYSYYYTGALSRLSVTYPDTNAVFGEQEHYSVSYYANGKPMHSALYPDRGRQPVTYYYLSGRKKAQGEWENGKTGAYIEYHENGKISAKGEYEVTYAWPQKDMPKTYFLAKTGHWIYYDEKGNKIRDEFYSGNNMSFITYDKGEATKSAKPVVVLPEVILQ